MNHPILAQNSPTQTSDNGLAEIGIYCNEDQIKYGQCKFNINKPLMIKQENQDPEPETVIQDRILATTFFIGTVVTIGLMISAVRMIYAFVTGEDISKYKNNVVNALIGMILVFSAYIIVRVIQYLVRT